jgi:DNA-binding XRE family transcriptional regulator
VRPWHDFDALFCYDWHAADGPTAEWVTDRLKALESVGQLMPTPERNGSDWSALFARMRRRARMTQERLSLDSGVSVSSIHSYEAGRRTPSRESAIALCRATQADSVSTNTVMRELGMEPLPSDYALWLTGEVRARGPLYHIAEARVGGMRREIEGLIWPCLVFDGSCRLVLQNRLAARLGEGRSRPVRRPHLLDVLADAYLAGSVLNVDEVLSRLVPESVRRVLNPANSERVDRGALAQAVRGIVQRCPELARILSTLWSTSEVLEVMRPVAKLNWRTAEGDSLVFDVVAARWSDASSMWALDFHPATAETWRWTERTN